MILSVQSAHVAELADACASRSAWGDPWRFESSREHGSDFVLRLFRILRQLRHGNDPSTTKPQLRSPHLRSHRSALRSRQSSSQRRIRFLWRARAARIIASEKPRRILDLATGSGDLALALRKASPRSLVVAAISVCPCSRSRRRVPALVQADGLQLPFQDGKFDALTVALGFATWRRGWGVAGNGPRATSGEFSW